MKTEDFLRNLQDAFLRFKANQEQKEWHNFRMGLPETDKSYQEWLDEFIEEYL